MRPKIALILLATAMAVLLCITHARAGPFGSASLSVDPPRMLYWGWPKKDASNTYNCEALRTSEIIEADPPLKAHLLNLPCGQAYGGKWMKYAIMFTAGASSSAPMFGDSETVPPEALLHWNVAGGYSCQMPDGSTRTVSWSAGDPIEARHFPERKSSICSYVPNRPLGTHYLVNPSHPWIVEGVKRYTRARVAERYSFGRIDEVRIIRFPDPEQTVEYAATPTRYESDWQARLRDMRAVDGWIATCPSQEDFWKPAEMALNRAGGCVSMENFPSGDGILPNLDRLTTAQLRAKWGGILLNTEPDGNVPNNVLLGMRYETIAITAVGVAQAVAAGRAANNPNLYFLFGKCGGIVGNYGTELQSAIGQGGDVVMCGDGWGRMRDMKTGTLPPWYAPIDHKPTWAQ